MSGLVQENEGTLEVGELTNCQVFADTDAVMQILGNLIENAIKYGRAKNGARARVVISAREVGEQEVVEFSVRDFGMGIASEHVNRIFERFYRVDKTRSRESGGTGLGLSIVRHMVQAQAGSIWAESELGLGSNFVFTLPKALYPVVYEG
jgi:two-component system phosphate regulon sensor histidine kinase PhoR